MYMCGVLRLCFLLPVATDSAVLSQLLVVVLLLLIHSSNVLYMIFIIFMNLLRLLKNPNGMGIDLRKL